MELGLERKPVELNPELQALRRKGLQESANQNNNDWISQLINRTSNIHAGFLFEDLKTLQNICLFVSETPNKISDAGWEAFGYHLGLSPSLLKVINYNNFNKEDPCYNTLLAYVQHENASLGKVIEALYVMGRIDVLSRIKNSLKDLADVVLNTQFSNNVSNNSIEDTSDYESLTEGCEQVNSNFSSRSEYFIKPKVIPPAPFIFQNIKEDSEFTNQQIQQVLNNVVTKNPFLSYVEKNSSKVQNLNVKIKCHENIVNDYNPKILCETLQNSDATYSIQNNFKNLKRQKYGLKILLTFAEDGEQYVDEICKIFRKKRKDYPSIGVLVLREHIANVNKDPQQFIFGAFQQVDYVCPILTSGYFNSIMKNQQSTLLSNMHIDAFYVRYIYRLINSYYISNDCLNDKIRCIYPENEFSQLLFNFVTKNPIFGAWVKLSEIDELALRLLKSKKKLL